MIVYRELQTLERDLGISAQKLYALANSITKHYHIVSIPKGNGAQRTLSIPDETLKQVQRRIAERLLCTMPVSQYATAYRYGISVKDCARPHVRAPQMLKLDIKHFFDGIMYSHVKRYAFPEKIYAEPLRVLLSILCYYKDVLPQGAPTSPVITNLILREFDERVGEWCHMRHIRYTRYCDDMIFSGTAFDADEVINYIKQELGTYGLYLNDQKTKRLGKGTRKTVTGIVINDRPRLTADYRRDLRQQIYYCQRYGVEEHLAHIASKHSPEHYLKVLEGRISYALSVDPNDKSLLGYRIWVREQLNKQ